MAEELSPAESAAYVALMDAQSGARFKIRQTVLDAVRQILAQLAGRWFDDDAVRRAGVQLDAVVRQGQVVTGDVTAAYLDHVYDLIGIDPPHGAVELPVRLRQVDPAVEWARPAAEFRRLRLQGLDEFEAAERARQRAETMAETDLDLAMREAARQRLAPADKVIGYRRVIHPELSETGTCGLCLVASDRTYHKAKLLPIHDRCQCEVLPIVAGKPDPGFKINRVDWNRIQDAAGDSGRAALKKVRVRVVEHGELGPLLVDAGHRWRDATTAQEDTGRESAA